jgi:hypothetical protein
MLPESLRWLLAALTVYRLARLVGRDALAGWLREWAGRRVAGGGQYSRAWLLAELLSCPYCLGIWFAAPVAALVLCPTLPGDLFLAWQGLAGGQAFLQSLGDRG